MKKRLLLCWAIFLSILALAQETPPAGQSAPGALGRKAAQFGTTLPQEKVFLHLDNTCYFVGDTIWFKAYVTHSDRQTPTDLSKILYVELFTPDGYLVERQQLEMPDGSAHGAFALKDSLYAGYYELRAYTLWMLNFGVCEHPHSQWTEDLFYNKQMAKEFFRDYDKIYSRVFPVFDQPDTPGNYAKDMTLRPMRRYFKSDEGKPELDVRFYPEGGELVEGTKGTVAFEARTQEGRHIDVELSIRNRDGKEVAQARTIHRGRGMFRLPAIRPGEKYEAVCRYEGYDYAFPLPEAAENGCALHVTQTDSTVHVAIQAGGFRSPLPAMGLQVMHGGVSKSYHDLAFGPEGKTAAEVPLRLLPTGVNQIVLFDGKGRVYADRLIFVNHHDYDEPQLGIGGLKAQYEPFEPVRLELRLKQPAAAAGQPDVSLAVRDRGTDEPGHDNGNILTELLLASELKGFVENPGFYFEGHDSLRLQSLDLLMMVQGWRRYAWKAMAGIEPLTLRHMPEQVQTISGCVNRIEAFRIAFNTHFDEHDWLPGLGTMRAPDTSVERDKHLQDLMKESDRGETGKGLDSDNTSSHDPMTQLFKDNRRDPFGHGYTLSNLKEEVKVWPMFVQGKEHLNVMQKTENGTFYLQTPLLYGSYLLSLMATGQDKEDAYVKERMRKGYTDEEAYPDYYVKLNRFYPRYTKSYDYYQDLPREEGNELTDPAHGPDSFTDRHLGAVVVRTRRGGLRKLDLSKPALVVDAYEAFNLAADYGMNTGTHNWVTFPQQVALTYVGDMGTDRDFFLQVRYDGKAVNLKSDRRHTAPQRTLNGEIIEIPPIIQAGEGTMEKYRHLRNLDKLYIYTDYAPREQGSPKYQGSNQPDVVIDYHRFPGDDYQTTYRDRHYVMDGYAVCEEFYNPDYSRKPLPDTKDYRRTLYWNPNVEFDAEGKATVNLYNNSKQTVLSVQAEGITADGTPLVWDNNEN